MIDKSAKILVAVSGGVDSVYMLHLLLKQGYTNLGVVHFNHMIRDESDKDSLFVSLLADQYNLPDHTTSVNIEHYASIRKESVELTARNLRRGFFEKVMKEYNYEWLVLGHHADDQAETVLYNLLRGSGVHGLAGMLKVDKEQKIFRPLLHMTKDEIYEAAKKEGLKWNEDYTNKEVDYDRNWLRNDIIPQLESRRQGVKKVLSDTATRMQDMSDYIKVEAQDWFGHYFLNNRNRMDVEHFMLEHKALRAEILGLLWNHYNGARKNFNNKITFEVEKWLSSNPEGGTEIYFGSVYLTLKKGFVSIIDEGNSS